MHPNGNADPGLEPAAGRDGTKAIDESRRLVPVKGNPGIYRRGGRYVVRYRDARGRQHKKFARTLAEARELRATKTADVARGEHRDVSRERFDTYAARWTRTYAGRTKNGIRDQTRREYAVALGIDPGPRDRPADEPWEPYEPARAAIEFFGRMRLAEIAPQDVAEYADSIAKRGVAADTVRLALAPLKALLATAVQSGDIRSNPSVGLRFVRPADGDEVEQEEKAKALSEDELERLLAAVDLEWRLLVTLVAQAGLRISEGLPLRWRDLDFGRRRLLVRRSVRNGRVGKPKTKNSRRDVPLTAEMATALWNARASAANRDDDALVFPARDGGFLDRGTVYGVVKRAAKTAGVPWAGTRTLRHTAASVLFRSGWNAKQVCDFLGHHSPAFTLSVYVHLLPDDLPEPTALAFGAPLGGLVGASRPAETGRDRAVGAAG
jgi:integrase